MKQNRRLVQLVFLTVIVVSCVTSSQSQPGDLIAAANTFLGLLGDDLRKKTQFSYEDAERFNWHFIPKERRGATFHDFNPQQKSAALNLLRLSVSKQGYKKATDIFHLEDILRTVESRPVGDAYRDSLNFHFSIFGTPSVGDVWGWRLEGHHISLNFSSLNNEINASTPSFFGSNPAIVPSGPERGWMVLRDESDLGFKLVNSLSAAQLQMALIADTAPHEIVTSNNRKASLEKMEGISYPQLTADQKRVFMELLHTYVGNYVMGFSERLMAKIEKAGTDNLHFAWAGSLKPGAGHYYRIQGPMLIIEFDNTQNNSNHIHTVVRDLTNDWGEDILREHYDKEHKP